MAKKLTKTEVARERKERQANDNKAAAMMEKKLASKKGKK